MQYLTVSSDQADAITRLNSNNQQSTTDRQQNISQLQAQITHETAKDTLDPMALGTLYAQVESIKREITKDMATLRNNARAVLTDMQRGKLTSLDDARKLQLLICQAGSENLLVPQPSLPLAITGLSSILIGSPVTFIDARAFESIERHPSADTPAIPFTQIPNLLFAALQVS